MRLKLLEATVGDVVDAGRSIEAEPRQELRLREKIKRRDFVNSKRLKRSRQERRGLCPGRLTSRPDAPRRRREEVLARSGTFFCSFFIRIPASLPVGNLLVGVGATQCGRPTLGQPHRAAPTVQSERAIQPPASLTTHLQIPLLFPNQCHSSFALIRGTAQSEPAPPRPWRGLG